METNVQTSIVSFRTSTKFQDRSETTPKGVDKIARYGWTVRDEPGAFAWLDKEILEVDHSYQRDEKSATIGDVARDFSWAAFGALQVAMRQNDDGTCRYFVFDGQNRLEGAMRRSDIRQVPCMVYEVDGIENEAEAFLTTNVGRKPVNAIEKHKASVLTGDRHATILDELVRSAGYTISQSSKPATLRCVGLCTRAISLDEDTFRRLWPVLIRITEGNVLHERLVDGLFYIARFSNQDILSRFWVAELARIGSAELLDAANKAAAYYAKGGAKVWADGMVARINKGRRTNLITLKQAA